MRYNLVAIAIGMTILLGPSFSYADIRTSNTDHHLSHLTLSDFTRTKGNEIRNITGILAVMIGESKEFDREYIEYLLHADNGNVYELYFEDQMPMGVTTGTKITIKKAYQLKKAGSKRINLLVKQSDINIGEAHSFALPESLGPQKTIIMLVNFQNAPSNKPFTIDQVKTNYFTTVSNMYYESSYHQTTVVGDVVGWFTVPINSTDNCSRITDDLPGFAEAQAKAAGVDFSQYRRKVYIFPDVPACSWGGVCFHR